MSNLSKWSAHLSAYRNANPDVPYKQAQKDAKETFDKKPARERGLRPIGRPRGKLFKNPPPPPVRRPKDYGSNIAIPKMSGLRQPAMARENTEIKRLKKKITEARQKLKGAGFGLARRMR